MKKLIILIVASLAATALVARPHGPRPAPVPPHHHHHHSRGGALAAGLVGGAILGGIVASAANPAPVVVQQPVVVQSAPVVVQPAPVVVQPVYQTQNVWVGGRYVDTVQPNGAVLRTWQPGHYESRTIRIQ